MRNLCSLGLLGVTIVHVDAFLLPFRERGNGAAMQAFTPTSLRAFDIAGTASTIDAFYQTQPYAAAFMTCSLKASAADLVVQIKGEEKENEWDKEGRHDVVDFPRNIGFLLYGGMYQGCVQEYLFNHVFPSVFGESHSWTTVVEQVALDMIVITPFLCLPVAYTMKAIVSPNDSIIDGLRKYASHVQNEGLLLRCWSIWTPVQFLTFSVVPSHLRIPFIAFVSFFWLMILSNISSQETQQVKE